MDYALVYRGFPNKTLPNWAIMEEAVIRKLMEETVTYMNMTSVKWMEEGVEKTIERLDLTSGTWSRIDYQRELTRRSIRETYERSLAEMILGLLSPISWAVVVTYNVAGFKKLYETSLAYATISGLIIFILLLLLGVM